MKCFSLFSASDFGITNIYRNGDLMYDQPSKIWMLKTGKKQNHFFPDIKKIIQVFSGFLVYPISILPTTIKMKT